MIKLIACSWMNVALWNLETLCEGEPAALTVGGLAHLKAVKLLPSAPWSLERTASASARIFSHLPLPAVDIDELFHRWKHQPLGLR
jgi:hypothetical protein